MAETHFAALREGTSSMARTIVAVRRKRSVIVGQLFMRTRTHIVLINNVLQAADLGRLRHRRVRHFDPEATVIVIPRDDVVSIETLDS